VLGVGLSIRVYVDICIPSIVPVAQEGEVTSSRSRVSSVLGFGVESCKLSVEYRAVIESSTNGLDSRFLRYE
jgi:hypothetical protein